MITNPFFRSPLWLALAAFALFSFIPTIDDDDDDGDDNDCGDKTFGISKLSPPTNPPDSNAVGVVTVAKFDGKQKFSVAAFKLPTSSPPGPFEVWLEDGAGTQTFFKVGEMKLVSFFLGMWLQKLEANGSAPVPLAVADVADLAGRGVEVRDAGGGSAYLTGIVSVGNAGGDDDDDEDDSSGLSQLLPPMNPPDLDAFGKVEVEKDDGEQEFKVVAWKLPTTLPPGPFEVWLEDGVGSQTMFKVGDMKLVSLFTGKWRLELESSAGPPLQLAVGDVNELAGRVVEVRDTGGANVYLTGIVVAGQDDDCEKGSGAASKGILSLQRPSPAPDEDAAGSVVSAKKVGKQILWVRTRNLDAGAAAPYSAHLETALGSNTFAPIGVLQPLGPNPNRFDLLLVGHCGPPATLGIQDIGELVGRKIQVRDAADQVVLQGESPELLISAGKSSCDDKAKLVQANNSPSAKGTGGIRLKFNAAQGQSEFRVDAKNLESGKSYSLWMESGVASGVLVKVGALGSKSKSGKNGTFLAVNKHGGPLPFGVAKVTKLKSRLVEIRDGSGLAHLVGVVP